MPGPVAEFVRGTVDHKHPKFMHEECYSKEHPKAQWKQWMMNGFFKGVHCSHCGVLLSCNCSQFKVSTPNSEECNHGTYVFY